MKWTRLILPVFFLAIGILAGGAGSWFLGMWMTAKQTLFSQRLQLTELEEMAYDAYRSSDSALGERVLLRYANKLQGLIEMGLTTEIPGKSELHHDLVLTYGRLGMLLEARGDQAKAREYYDLALQQWKSKDNDDGDQEMNIAKLKSLVTTYDAIEVNSQPER